MHVVLHLLALIRALASDRSRLALENVVLRQQLKVLKRSVKRAKVEDSDRVFWVLMYRFLEKWKEHLVMVKPDTVVRWHRQGFRYYWRRKSRQKPGRPTIAPEIIHLIRRMSSENALWGAPRVRDELALLGYTVCRETVSNHMAVSAACDFFTVPTLTFTPLYVFVVLSHDRRRIVHVNVTRNPTAEWTANQITEAFPGDAPVPRYFHRDRDRDNAYGEVFRRRVAAMDIREVV